MTFFYVHFYRCLTRGFKTYPCNCDAQFPEWAQDAGTITAKELLPIKEVYYGPHRFAQNKANYTIGQMQCYGKYIK